MLKKHNAEQSINIFSFKFPDIGSLSHFTSNIPRTVDKVALNPGTVNSSDKNFGLKLCQNLENVFKLVETGFQQEGILAIWILMLPCRIPREKDQFVKLKFKNLKIDAKLHEPSSNILEIEFTVK